MNHINRLWSVWSRNSIQTLCVALGAAMVISCTKDSPETNSQAASEKQELWVYTSLYKDTIADLTPRLQKAFPGVKFNWFQAGSEEIATKVNAEILAGGTRADVLISSDRFWYEEMAKNGKLHSYQAQEAKGVPDSLRHPDGFYTTVSIPVMVLGYNSEAISEAQAPKTFKEMAEGKWKNKFTTGSPLASGTNFTTVAMLQHHYGWDYIKALRNNETISQGGNSAVLRRIQSKERPVGWVLLENLLRFQDKDKRLKAIFPDDGVVLQSNVMAITKKSGPRELAEQFAEYMFGPEGQTAMIRSYMYSPMDKYDPPKGAPKFSQLRKKSFPWTRDFIDSVVQKRVAIKEKFAEVMFE